MREIETRVDHSCTGATSAAAPGNGDETRVKSARSYEINVSLADGSSRLITVADPANWRAGERLIVIAGTAEFALRIDFPYRHDKTAFGTP